MSSRLAVPGSVLLVGLVVAVMLGACGPGGPGAAASPSPAPSALPTPTPIGAPVTTPDGAAALVIATNRLFAGAVPLTQNLIGASRWWTAAAVAGGGYTIELTVGWGDCPAGCISRHVWTFSVTADGAVNLLGQTGDPVPASLPD